MDQHGSSQHQPSSSAMDNPVMAVGRKVKSIFSSHQRPSVRILRAPSSHSTGKLQRGPASTDFAEKPLPPLPPRENAPSPSTEPTTLPAEFRTRPRGNTLSDRFADARSRAGSSVQSLFGRGGVIKDHGPPDQEYDTDTVDLLDVVDPEVATLSTLTNVQNSLFVPSLGRFIDRQPAYRLSESDGEARTIDKLKNKLKQIASLRAEDDQEGGAPKPRREQVPLLQGRSQTTTTTLKNAQYAILPDDGMLQGWTREDEEELDDLVRHKLHSRRARFKRAMKGFGQYVRRPLGLFITIYATLITLFGAAWVLFLIGWISLGSKQDYVVNVVDNVLVALFAIIGDGLAPFRAVDTYHMIYIAHYHRKTWKRRAKLGLPELVDHNDLPDQRKEDVQPRDVDLESLVARRMPRGLARIVAPHLPNRLARRMVARSGIDQPSYDYSVLTKEQQERLEYHERKFSKSHTFYKPHETETHYAFPLKLLVAVVVLLDLHSCLQISLGACTWGIPYKSRPFALTTVILCCSITCNITGGVLISVGDKRTRKKDVIERMMRQELTSEAIEQMESRWLKEAEERGEINRSERKKVEEEREEAENEEIKRSWKAVPALPKILLGKGEDHRQPSLPQQARRSSANVASPTSGSSTPRKGKSRSNVALPSLQEDSAGLARPKPVLRKPVPVRGEEPTKEGTGQKVMKFIRRADLDRS